MLDEIDGAKTRVSPGKKTKKTVTCQRLGQKSLASKQNSNSKHTTNLTNDFESAAKGRST